MLSSPAEISGVYYRDGAMRAKLASGMNYRDNTVRAKLASGVGACPPRSLPKFRRPARQHSTPCLVPPAGETHKGHKEHWHGPTYPTDTK